MKVVRAGRRAGACVDAAQGNQEAAEVRSEATEIEAAVELCRLAVEPGDRG